jgi:hypothetical protein
MFAGIGFACLVVVKTVLVVEARIGKHIFQLPLVIAVLVVLFEFGRKPIAFEGFTLDFEGEING